MPSARIEEQVSQLLITVKAIQSAQTQQNSVIAQQFSAVLTTIANLQNADSSNFNDMRIAMGELIVQQGQMMDILNKILTDLSTLPPVIGGVYFGIPIQQ